MTGLLMIQFIISPKLGSHGATNNRFDSSSSLPASACLPLSPIYNSAAYIFYQQGFGVSQQFEQYIKTTLKRLFWTENSHSKWPPLEGTWVGRFLAGGGFCFFLKVQTYLR